MRAVKLGAPLLLVCSLTVAHAAGLGGVAASSLGVWVDGAVIAAPPILACDDMARPAPTGGTLDGRPVQDPLACGPHRWTIGRGSWSVADGRASASGSNSTAFLGLGIVEVSVEATFRLGGNGPNRAAGVVLHHSNAANHRYLAAVVTGSGHVEVRLGNGPNNVTVLASTPVPVLQGDVRLRATRSGDAVDVAVNGAHVLRYVLRNNDLSRLGPGSGSGWYDATGAASFADLIVSGV